LLNEILDLSKVEAGQMELTPGIFSVGNAIEYAMSMVRERASAHGISLNVHVAADIGEIEADELRFKQIVLNLVGNAVKFTPDGGHVTVSATTADDQILVRVTDDAPGIAAEDRERIFESFQQGGRGPTSEEGTGLGLALCRRIVELFGGRLWLESELGHGSTFGVAIPLTRPRPEPAADGTGNGRVDLTGLPAPGDADEQQVLIKRVAEIELESPDVPRNVYLAKLSEGGIVEERIVGWEVRSPSVQLRITPTGDIELLSTHDQRLGGPAGQSYLGCAFPAEPGYARTISRYATVAAERLVALDVLGRFALDFVVVREVDSSWSAYAIELNLRKGGTTHPFLTLQFLTDGRYDPHTALFMTATGRERHLVATDHLESERLKALTVPDLFDVIARHGLHFHQARQSGIVFHMISSLTECGRVGLTAVGTSRAEAQSLHDQAERILLDESTVALAETPLSTSEGLGVTAV
jgi:hypothetical protein